MLRFVLICLAIWHHAGVHSVAVAQVDGNENGIDILKPYRQPALERWEEDIQKLEELDSKEAYSENAILFLGSSSIRRWESIAEDLSPWEPIRRGYGGARFSDLAVFVERLVPQHKCQAIVIFVGNDISGSKQDKSPAEACGLFQYIVKSIRKSHQHTPVFCIAVTPTSSRFDVWPKVKEMNGLIEKYCSQDPTLHFIPTEKYFLDSDQRPKDELFVDDRLHLNDSGYRLWAKIIKQHLNAAFRGSK